jgi:ferredoxin
MRKAPPSSAQGASKLCARRLQALRKAPPTAAIGPIRYLVAMQIELNIDACIGSGSCEMLAPEVFAIGDDGYVQLISTPDEGARAGVEAAATACPTGVISVI